MSEIFVRAGPRMAGRRAAGFVLFALLAAIGLQYIKWTPSLHKLSLVAAGGGVGPSILAPGGHVHRAPWRAAWQYAWTYGRDIWQALLLGLLLGAGAQALVPAEWIGRLFGRSGHRSTAMAGLLAIPSMMCTCCAAPIAVGFKQAGASARAALAYWLGNPLLNPATLLLIAFVLGWRWMALRLVLGLLLVFGLSYLVDDSTDFNWLPAGSSLAEEPPLAGAAELELSIWVRWRRELWRLSISLIPEYLILVFLLGATQAWLFPMRDIGEISGFWWTTLLACTGTLFVIPTAAEIPIVQTMMAAGLGTGPAAALLITLPALSLPSLVMMAKALPPRALVSVALVTAVTGVLAGCFVWALRF